MGIHLEDTRHNVYIHRGARYLLLHEGASLERNIAFLHDMVTLDIKYRHKSISKTYGVKDSESSATRFKDEDIGLDEFCHQLKQEDPIILAEGQDYEDIDTWDHDIHLIAEAGLSLREVSNRLEIYRDERPRYDLFLAIPQTDENLERVLELVKQHYGDSVRDLWKEVT